MSQGRVATRLHETHTTVATAEVALTKLLRRVDQRQHPKSRIMGREAVVKQWLEVAELGVTTREQYDDLMRLYIDPTPGTMQVGTVDAELLERFYARLSSASTSVRHGPRRATSASRWSPEASRTPT